MWKNNESIHQDKFYKITIALAGIIQTVYLLRELAQTGKINEGAYKSSIYSIFQTNPEKIEDIYGNLEGIKLGFEQLILLFTPRNKIARPLLHYTLMLINLQRKISRSKKGVTQLTERITRIKKQVDYFHLIHPTVIANLADAYMSTISPFKLKIIIWGSQRSLSVTDNMDKIRALLLAGIRSVVLWRQMGGSRLQLFLFRAKIKATAKKILEQIEKGQ